MSQRIDQLERERLLAKLDHHAPNAEQIERITVVRQAAKAFLSALMDNCVYCGDLERALFHVREGMMFGVASIVLEDGVATQSHLPEKRVFAVGERVYHRRMDLMARIRSLDEEHALIKYEFPRDPESAPATVLLSDLIHANEALDRYSR